MYNNNNNNNNNKGSGKKLKYEYLGTEIQRLWNLKCTIIPVIIGAAGIVRKSLRTNLEAISGKHSILVDSLQQTAVLGTAHIIRKVLQCGAGSVSGGGHRWVKGSTGKEKCDKRRRRRQKKKKKIIIIIIIIMKELRTTAILGITHRRRKVLM
jgi:hypothetical protein